MNIFASYLAEEGIDKVKDAIEDKFDDYPYLKGVVDIARIHINKRDCAQTNQDLGSLSIKSLVNDILGTERRKLRLQRR
jgi:hypothetical protein